MHDSSKPGLTANVLVFLWPVISTLILLAFSATELSYQYRETFDGMVATKYILTILGHILALAAVPIFIYILLNARKAKGKGFFIFFITTMIVVVTLQCFLRAASFSCIGDGCHSENLPIQFQHPLTLITVLTLIGEAVSIGIVFKKKLS